jgi:hypothetical protein
MDGHDVVHLCHAVERFGAKQGWRFKALPVITWEFADFHDFAFARQALCDAIRASFPSKLITELETIINPNAVRIEAVRCTFILTCHVTFDLGRGPTGAAEMVEGRDYMTNRPPAPGSQQGH